MSRWDVVACKCLNMLALGLDNQFDCSPAGDTGFWRKKIFFKKYAYG
jgi:hypothetical protein